MTKYIFNMKVRRLEERTRTLRSWKDEQNNIQTEEEKLGWFIVFEGSWEALYLGDEKPDIKVGQLVKVILEPQ